MREKIKVSTGSSWEPIVGYSRAIRVGNCAEVAGTTAVNGDEVLGGDDAYQQTVHALEEGSYEFGTHWLTPSVSQSAINS